MHAPLTSGSLGLIHMRPSKNILAMTLVAVIVIAIAPAVRGNRAAAPVRAPEAAITMSIKSDEEHGKLGPEGTWHDVFSNATFSVHAGERVTVTILNYDTGPHTFNAPELGINVAIYAGSLASPYKTVFHFTAPKEIGTYGWSCLIPCDPWAMTHEGYMRGYVRVTA